MRFQIKGTLGEDAFYVERSADKELFEALRAGEFCYVLAPRQIGKSSLRVRVERRLEAEGILSASVDLTTIGSSGVTENEWYYSVLEEISEQLGLERDPSDYWTEHETLPPVRRFTRFIRDEILAVQTARVVICIDEIDLVLSLPFSRDDFFAAIRSIYNMRADDPAYERVTFCLFGVATPSELIDDAARTPFNIGRPIRIEDFSRSEAEAFLPGLEGAGGDPRVLLDEVLDWTGGHPYMTHRLCAALASESAEGRPDASEAKRVSALVKKLFLARGRTEDANLAYAEKRMDVAPEAMRTAMLRVYRRLLHGERIAANFSEPAHQELRLAGLVASRSDEEGDKLVIRSRIFAEVFGQHWVDERDTENPLSAPVAAWLRWHRGADFLLRGVALERALEWAEGRKDLSSEEHEFLRASVQVREREHAEAHARIQRKRYTMALIALLAALSFAIAMFIRSRELEASKLQVDAAFAALTKQLDDVESSKLAAERRAVDAEQKAKEMQEKAAALERSASHVPEDQEEAELVRKQAAEIRQSAEAMLQQAAEERKLAKASAEIANRAQLSAGSPDGADGVSADKALEVERNARIVAEGLLNLSQTKAERTAEDLREAREQIDALKKALESCRGMVIRPKKGFASAP